GGQGGKLFISFRLLIQCGLKKLRSLLVSEKRGVSPRSAVTGYLVVLNSLSRCDEARIAYFLICLLFHYFAALRDEPFHAFAFFATSGLVVNRKNFLQPLGMLSGLF